MPIGYQPDDLGYPRGEITELQEEFPTWPRLVALQAGAVALCLQGAMGRRDKEEEATPEAAALFRTAAACGRVLSLAADGAVKTHW
jgi:hypothetical protein